MQIRAASDKLPKSRKPANFVPYVVPSWSHPLVELTRVLSGTVVGVCAVSADTCGQRDFFLHPQFGKIRPIQETEQILDQHLTNSESKLSLI